ncbi:MAG: DUF4430 domain-containing protein [Oscillospiraceae bacterium]|nr:DUF4430 domain-containing protein [Oscillospiraceae bacterium]
MQKTSFKKTLSCILCTVLIAASALITTGCTNSTANEEPSAAATVSETSAADTAASEADTAAVSEAASDVTVLGEGQTKFTFSVTDIEGNESVFEISTDKTNVGEVLLEHGLIAGEESEYGLYVKQVNGITADYDIDGTYWAFYIDGEYAMTGVDSTEITAGSAYAFKAEK